MIEEGGRHLGAAAFRETVDRGARWLRAAGIDRSGLLADNGADWVIADAALDRGGIVNVPLPDQFSFPQLAHAVDDVGVDAVLADPGRRSLARELGFSDSGCLPGTDLALLRRARPTPAVPLPPGTIKVTYTSGSTAAPKGVCLGREALDSVAGSLSMLMRSLGIRRHLVLLPLSTLLENIAGVTVPFRSGACCVVPPASVTGVTATRVDPTRFLETIAELRPESLILVPQLLQALVHGVERGWKAPSSLSFIAVGGARLPRDLLEQAREAGLPCYEGYGLSECASVVALNTPAADRAGSVGRPLPHARVRVDDRGEIRVAGAVMSGYTGGGPAGEEIATGDLGAFDDDGFLYVHGRRKNMFITAFGRNVCPEWIEAELLSSPAVAQAFAAGEARPWIAAVITPAPGASAADISAAVHTANARLPDYAKVQRWLLADEPFSFDNGLLTANGRLRRAAIGEHYQQAIHQLYCDALAS